MRYQIGKARLPGCRSLLLGDTEFCSPLSRSFGAFIHTFQPLAEARDVSEIECARSPYSFCCSRLPCQINYNFF